MDRPNEPDESTERPDDQALSREADDDLVDKPRDSKLEHAEDDGHDVHDENDYHGQCFFRTMARFPWPFLVLVPAVFVVILVLGWTTTDDKVEQEVSRLWIAQSGDYAADIEYAESWGVDDLGSSSFAALAIGRDGGNMLTAERLEVVRARMEATEGTTVQYKGNTFTWDDFCSVNSAPYQLPCLRLSPMDLFKEARWTFTTLNRVAWYQGLIKPQLLAPRLGRFGALEACMAQCGTIVQTRYGNNEALKLFSDVGNLEYNHPCKICLEAAYDKTVTDLHAMIVPTLENLKALVLAHNTVVLANDDSTQAAEQRATNEDIIAKLETLHTTLTTNDVAEFYKYYVIRTLYSQLGVESYLASYASFASYIQDCVNGQATAQAIGLNVECPRLAAEMNATHAAQDLLRHADNAFSSVTTAGAPFPFWSSPDGTGVLFQGDDSGMLWPVSGSGVDMSAEIASLPTYVGLTAATGATADPSSDTWRTEVEVNPLYAWFMAGLTPADSSTVCANGNLTGTPLDPTSSAVLASLTPRWCTPFDVPNPSNQGPAPFYTKQHFARMWYDLLISSEAFLGIEQGSDDPYSWTTGAGCGYSLGGERFSYTGKSEESILGNSSRLVYNIDEGVSLGPVDHHLLLGGIKGEFNEEPLEEVKVLQSLYGSLLPPDIVKRVSSCIRPGGAISLTVDEAQELLEIWKEAMEDSWNQGWDDEDDGEVQMVSFFDDGGGTIGSTGRMLTEITLDNTTLTIISIFIIAFFSAIFLFSFDLVESRVLVTLVGVGLVVLSFFSALGFALLTGTKINVTIGWTLPFVIIGLGVDDAYIILLALKKQGGYTLRHWLQAMEEVVVPVTMTSLVNVSMFAVLRFASDIPAIYLTSRVALYCIIALYISVMFCFPAYCYLDMVRQGNNRIDFVCSKSSKPADKAPKEDFRNIILYDSFYKPIVLNQGNIRYVAHAIILLIAAGLLGVGIYGIKERQVGLGLADFFPDDNPAGRWAEIGGNVLASWSIAMNWGALNYTDARTQMLLIQSFENVVMDPRVGEVDTKQLWMADFLLWTSRHCNENFARPRFDVRMCGRDQAVPDEVDSFCAGTWTTNTLGLRLKNIAPVLEDETCVANSGGICRSGQDMHFLDLAELELTLEDAQGLEFCPVVQGWSDSKWQFCLERWRTLTGGSGRLLTQPGTSSENACGVVTEEEGKLIWPIPYSYGPTMFVFDVFTHEQTLDMMRDTRAFCDDNEEIHCWLGGIPFDYWTQYEDIFNVLLEMCGYAILAGFVIGFAFLFGKLLAEQVHSAAKVFVGSVIGAALLSVSMLLTLTTVVGLSILADVNLTGFSNMSFVLSVGFTVEYAVHIISRWMRSPTSLDSSLDRVDYTMSFLMVPTFMSFVSSTIGVTLMAWSPFDFVDVFFFRPLIIVMFVSWFFGTWFLPVVLVYLDFSYVKLGHAVDEPVNGKENGVHGGNVSDEKMGAGPNVDSTEEYGGERPVKGSDSS